MLFETVCLATDFSPVSARAADYVLRLTEAGCRKVVLLHVVNIAKEQIVISEPPGLDADSATAYEDTIRERLHQTNQQEMTDTVARFRDAGLAVETVILSGNPADEIVRVADSREASLIVVGAHGRTGLKQAFLGSVSAEVIRRARQPVLVVRGSESQ
ncbi:universal stress protein [Methanogenium organophilum]|uniref:Universal stress protein n=1 Tax=Methanogenium organophilum TaxID=2199 RepID=A0A9X9T9U3_METOG|nr:universal stress protein [Methanogenium organophilum]WAI02427.1 universal stress protein [Methanogenium organophilum]